MPVEPIVLISADALHYVVWARYVGIISSETFDAMWSFVDSAYSKQQQELLQGHGSKIWVYM